ncbi:MAG: CRTAC1 family protein, partial [Anaerolineae bacterium]|nr:CRTAC1 family protein [Anaerolineae bacterium]
CVDRKGDGRYGFIVANYGGPLRLYELDDDGFLHDVAPEIGLNLVTGGRSLLSLPLVSEKMDIFAGNELGPNFLFLNQGDGTFHESASGAGLSDPYEHVRGVTTLDSNGNGRFDLVYGNWEGTHRMFVQETHGLFSNCTPYKMSMPSKVRTVLAADFDNDGYEEIFFNNIGQPNRLFGWRNGEWTPIDIGDAAEPTGMGTGAVYGDFDGDGRLELLISHGESVMQPLSLYHTPVNDNNWLRVLPLTVSGAPARGAVVKLKTEHRTQVRVIDAGSGYLCQMEPVAHFGLGKHTEVQKVEVQWPDGVKVTLPRVSAGQLLTVPHP